MKIANQDLLGPDPGWHGQVSQPTLTLRTGVSYVLFILYLVFVGVTANWAQLPATMAAILVPVLAAPALSVLRRYGLPIARPQPPNGDVMGQTSAQSTCNDP
ncbi:hypothetical protein DUI70_2996 [Streptomyces albus]|nr:hypothetical protein DUI70_2996 [Streptomyces albus]